MCILHCYPMSMHMHTGWLLLERLWYACIHVIDKLHTTEVITHTRGGGGCAYRHRDLKFVDPWWSMLDKQVVVALM